MKQLVNSVKNLFGADVKLRKWCIETAIRMIQEPAGADSVTKEAEKLKEWITAPPTR